MRTLDPRPVPALNAPALPAVAPRIREVNNTPAVKAKQLKKRAPLLPFKALFRCIVLPPYCFYHLLALSG